ncbi:GL13766 [Drosophila persimilis]|uniref:GL13766 n=1 Tax=Drosophila persimilis TaxID=7234 RepID=B4IQT9_DROPE|nr:GL13766 [Drosophila persimilis]
MANFQVLMSNSLTEDRADQVLLNNNNSSSKRSNRRSRPQPNLSAVHSKANPMKIGWKFGCLGAGFCLGIDEDIVVADSKNHRIAVYAKMGALKFQFGDAGKRNGQLFYPRKVAVFQHNGNFVACDRGNGRSRMQIFSNCTANLQSPTCPVNSNILYIADHYEYSFFNFSYIKCDHFSSLFLLIGDTHGYRFHVTCYGSDGVFKSVFDFPQLNVSRCCGLKITSEGYVVTLAKNNHQVLVMDLLYV